MPREIERKFLVASDSWRGRAVGVIYRQGYLSTDPERIVRVRTAGDDAFLTVKGLTTGNSRLEFEYPIPFADAEQMLALCKGPLVEKTRFEIPYAGKIWQVDEFLGDNLGLIVAEVELSSDADRIELPDWIGNEVSSDPRYYNSSLTITLFSRWSQTA